MLADYSLNAANELTVAYLREQGAPRITCLVRPESRAVARSWFPAAAVDLLEVVIHQHMPMFHMEHCVFCSVLSPGTNKTQLRTTVRHRHRVQLRDRIGMEHR
jgi:U32 family peptidase